jgi:predicted NBD/HSP70 family sugar kinase
MADQAVAAAGLGLPPEDGGGPASQQGMRRQNLGRVMQAIAARGPVSRAELADSTGLTRAAVGSLVGELQAAGLVTDQGLARSGRAGRPGSLLDVNSAGPAGLGLEVGVGHLAGCLIDLHGAARAWVRVEASNRGRSPAAVLADLAAVAGQVAGQGTVLGLRPVGTMLAVPGLVGTPGVVEHAPNLGWHQAEAGLLLRDQLPGPLRAVALRVANEANLGALAELWHSAPASDFIHVSADAGIGAALVVGGQVLPGARGFAGELGHVPVQPDGPPCACGARGCLEQYAGEQAVVSAAGLPPGPGDPVGALAGRAAAGDARARAALDRAGRALGTALAGAVLLLDPELVILGGAYADLGPWLLPGIRQELAARVTTVRPWAPGAVVVSRLGRRGPLLGAGMSTVRQIISDPWLYGQLQPAAS